MGRGPTPIEPPPGENAVSLHALSLWSDGAGAIFRLIDPSVPEGFLGRIIGDIEGLSHAYRPSKPPGVGPGSPPRPSPDQLASLGNEAMAAINVDRHAQGLARLAWNDRLAAAALKHARDLAARRSLSHTGSDGSTPALRVARSGYAALAVAENIAFGYATPYDVAAGWQNDPPHRQNDLGPYHDFGCAVACDAFGLAWWCADFGSPAA